MSDARRYCTVEIRMIVSPKANAELIERSISNHLHKDIIVEPGEVDVYCKIREEIKINLQTNFAIPLPPIPRDE